MNSKAKMFGIVPDKSSADPGKMNWLKKKSAFTFNKSNHEKFFITDSDLCITSNFLYR